MAATKMTSTEANVAPTATPSAYRDTISAVAVAATSPWAKVVSRQKLTALRRRSSSSPACATSRARTHGLEAPATVPQISSSAETDPTTAYSRAGSIHTSSIV